MHAFAVEAKRSAPSGSGRHGFWTSLVVRIEKLIATWQERRVLLSASDHMLRDLGLSRADAYREGSRPFWDVPAR